MTPCTLLERATVAEEPAPFIFWFLREDFSLTVNVADSSETSVFFYQATRVHISVEDNIDSYDSTNFKFYKP
jgi:hypothetical protein